MKVGRYTTIEPSDTVNREELKSHLTLCNPQYASAVNAGASIKYLHERNIPETITLYKLTNDSIEIPKFFLNDQAGILEHDHDLPLPIPSDTYHNYDTIDIEACHSFIPREYQMMPILSIARNESDILNAPCGSGKTAMAINVITRLKRKTAVIVNSEFLINQWKKAIVDFTSLRESDIGIAMKQWYKLEAITKLYKASVVIFTVQGLINRDYNNISTLLDKFGLTIFDETHLFGSQRFREAIDMFKCRRIGLTATVRRTDKLRTFIWGIGNRIIRADYEGLKPSIKFVCNRSGQYNSSEYMVRGSLNYSRLVNTLTQDVARTKNIVQIIVDLVKEGRAIMVLTHRRSHAEQMRVMLGNKDINTHILLGGESFCINDIQNSQCIVATFQYVKHALDVPHVDTLVLTTPFSNRNDVQQSTGRILRAHEGKMNPMVVDVYDLNVGPCVGMAINRQKAYRSLKYDVLNEVRRT